jgi:PAS domain S-box-containing protein
LVVLFALAPLVLALGLTAQLDISRLPLELILAFFILLAAFVFDDLLAGKLESGAWAGYLNFTLMVALLSLSSVIALWVLLLGVGLAAGIRWLLGKRLRLEAATRREIVDLALGRLAVNGFALAVTVMVSLVMNHDRALMWIGSAEIAPLILLLLTNFAVTQWLGAWLVPKPTEFRPLWATGQPRLIHELFLLLVVPIMPLMLYNSGPVAFGILIALTVSQAYRGRLVTITQQTLVQRVQELSAVNSVGQAVSVSLALDDVLLNIHNEIRQIVDITAFMVALYDENQDRIDYRLVMERGERVYWPPRRLNEGAGISAHVIRTRKYTHITADETERMNSMGVDASKLQFWEYLCVPLMVSQKLIGLMAVMRSKREQTFRNAEIELVQTVANQAALAIRNATLYDRTMELALNLRRINESVQDVMFNLDSEDAMRAACQTAIDMTNAKQAAIYLLDIEGKRAQLAQQTGFDQSYLEQTRTMPYDPTCYEDGRRTVSNVISNQSDPNVLRLAKVGGYQAFAEVPLRSGNTLTGHLVVYHEEPHYYHEAELELLETLAYQVTAALDNAELLKALELYASEQAQLVHLSRISNATLKLETVVVGICEILRQMMSVSRANIGLLIPGRDRLHFYSSREDETDFELDLANLPLDHIPELNTNSQEYTPVPRVFTRDDESTPPVLLDLMQRGGDEMLMSVPLVTDNRLIGVVLLGSDQSRVFSDGERRLMEMAANQVATQIHNAQLFGFTRQALDRRLNQLSLIERIAQQISSALDREELINNVLEAALQATQADMAALALLDGDKFRVIGQELIDGEWYEYQTTQPKEMGLMGHVLKTGKPQMVTYNDVSEYQSQSEGIYLSALAVPLLKEGEVIGVLNVESVRPDFFTEEQSSFLNNLAGHAMISIENARLLEEREYQIKTLTSLRQLSLQLSSALDKKEVAQSVLRSTINILNGRGASLYEFDPKTLDITLLNSVWLENGEYFTSPMYIPDVVMQRATNGSIQIIGDVTQHEDYSSYEDLPKVDYASLLVVPIRRGNVIQELMCISFPRRRNFDQRDLNTVELLAIQIAAHVENAALLEKVRANNTQMRAILDATRDGVILLDREGYLRDVNLRAEEMLGLNLEENIGENFPMMLMAHAGKDRSDGLTHMARNLRLEPERISKRRFELPKEKGATLHIEEVATPVRDTKGNIIGRLLTLRDITEERALAEYRDEITHMVVHDLRSPLGSIISSLDFSLILLQSDDIGPDSPLSAMSTSLEVSLDSANSLLNLVDSILDIAKLERDEFPLKLARVSVKSMAEEAYKRLANSIQGANIDLEIVIPDNLQEVYVDPDLITRVMTNLIDNAVKFTNGKIQVSAGQFRQRDHIVVRVADNGRGIPAEERERVFEKYRQIMDNKPARGRKGTGLGLTLCKVAIEAHGERIWVEPEGPLPGACFAFTLPVAAESVNADHETTPTVVRQSES